MATHGEGRGTHDGQHAYDRIPHLVWCEDSRGRVSFVNVRAAEHTGRPHEHLLLHGLMSDLHPEDRQVAEQAIGASRQTGRPYRVEARVRRHDRRYVWFRFEGRPVADSDDNPGGWVHVCSDIDDLKTVELRSMRFRRVVDALARHLSTERVVNVLLDHGLRAVDAYAGAMLLLTEDETELQLAGERGYTADVSAGWRNVGLHEQVPVAMSLRQRRALFYRNRAEIADNGVRYPRSQELLAERTHAFAVIPLYVDHHDLGALILSFDTERDFPEGEQMFLVTLAHQAAQALERARLHELERRARRELERTRALLDTLLDRAPVGFALLDGNLRFLRVNATLAEITNVPAERMLGEVAPDVLPDLPEAVAEAARHVLRTNVPLLDVAGTWFPRHGEGEVRHWLSSYYPVHAPDDVWLGVGVLVQETTERVRAEHELRRLNADLEHRVEERTRRWQDLSAELTAYAKAAGTHVLDPARRIGDTLRLVQNRYGDHIDPRARRLLGLVQDEAARVAGRAVDLLNLSVLEQSELDRQRIPLLHLVVQVRSDLEPALRRHRVKWVLEDLPTITADAILIRQALTELFMQLLNATSERETATIRVRAETRETEVVLEIRSTLPTVTPPDALGLPGELDAAQRESGGLAQVRRIVVRHGGRLWMEAEEGGVAFFMALPSQTEAGP